MQELHYRTNDAISDLLGRLEREENRIGDNPLFTVIEQALYLLREASKNSLSFSNYSDVLSTIQDRLDEKNDQAYEMREETNRDILAWLREF